MPPKKDESLFIRVQNIVKKAKKLEIFIGDPDSQKVLSAIISDGLRQELDLYEKQLSASAKTSLIEKLAKLSMMVGKLKSHTESSFRLDEAIVIRTNEVLSAIRMEASKSQATEAKVVSLPHIQPMKFSGVKTITDNPDDYVFCLSQTIPPNLILRKKDWDKAQSLWDGEFVIGVTNCPVSKPFSDRRVCWQTLRNASAHDIEVFNAIHELARLGYNFDLGVLLFRDPDKPSSSSKLLVEDYGLTKLMIETAEKLIDPKSFLIRVIAESKNLTPKNSLKEILDHIPFERLTKKGINNICLDMMSCNTVEMIEDTTKIFKEIAEKFKIKISVNFYDGYVQNNNSFCYINPDEQKRMLQMLETKQEAGEIDPTISYSEHSKTLSFPLIQDKESKTSSLVQFVSPGFSIFDAHDMIEMQKWVLDKPLQAIQDSFLERQTSRGSSFSEDRSPLKTSNSEEEETQESPPSTSRLFSTTRIVTKLLVPTQEDQKVPFGRVIEWSTDHRVQTLEHEAGTAATPAGSSPQPTEKAVKLAPETQSQTQSSTA